MERKVPSYPDWFLEANAGAARLEDQGDLEGANRVRAQAGIAYAIWQYSGAVGSAGQPLMGENGSTQKNVFAPITPDHSE